jgi:hypothetical protein
MFYGSGKTNENNFAGSSITSIIITAIFSCWHFDGYDTMVSCWRPVSGIKI